MKTYNDLFVVMLHFSEDGPQEVSPYFRSFRKASDWRYSSAGKLEMKRCREAAMGYITGMNEEMDVEVHVAALRLTRAEKRRAPQGWVIVITAKEQQESDDEDQLAGY
jgi:hypothetical protein